MLLVLVLLGPALIVAGKAAWEAEACPAFERKKYDYVAKVHVEGDLYALEHVRGFTDFKNCFQVRDRVTEERVRYEIEKGAYEVRVIGSDFDDRYLLTPRENVTEWYDARRIHEFQFIGVSGGAEPGTNLLPEPRATELTLVD